MSFSAMSVVCGSCGKRFFAYPDRKGASGKYPKHCSRACFLKAQARQRELDQRKVDEGIVIRVPAKFFDDHEERECEPFCSPIKRTKQYVTLYWNDAGLDELLDDARHYADEEGGPDAYEGSAAMRRSAAATVAAIEAARAALSASRAKRQIANG